MVLVATGVGTCEPQGGLSSMFWPQPSHLLSLHPGVLLRAPPDPLGPTLVIP